MSERKSAQTGKRESQEGPTKDAENFVVSDPEHCTHFTTIAIYMYQ